MSAKNYYEQPQIPPPSSVTVETDFGRRGVLYQPDGKALVRPVGFVPAKRKGDRQEQTP